MLQLFLGTHVIQINLVDIQHFGWLIIPQHTFLAGPLKKMYATGGEPSMLCSLTSYSSIARFKFPAHTRPTVEFGGKPIKALSQSTTFDKDDGDDDSG